MPKCNNFTIRFLFSCALAFLLSSYITSFENTRLSVKNEQEKNIKNVESRHNIENYFFNITSMLDQIESKYNGNCSNDLVMFMRRGLFSILGGIEFGIIKKIKNESYVICNSWGADEITKVRDPVNFDGYLVSGPHIINSLGEPIYIIKKTRNNTEYNIVLKLSSLSAISGYSGISLIKNDNLLYGSQAYEGIEKSAVLSNVKYGFMPGQKIVMPLFYNVIIFIFILILAYFLVAKRIFFIIDKYFLIRKINSGLYFYNVFQPIFDSTNNTVFSYEVFTRAPGHSDALSIVHEIKKFKIHDEHAINQIEQVKLLPIKNNIQINISVKNILSERFFTYVSNLESEFIKHVIFEITEDENLLENKHLVSQRMKSLKKAGYRFAIDDYGIGYSNLAYLVELNFDYIKIDKSMIRNDKRNLLNIIKTLVSDLGATCIAEGIECSEQKEMLSDVGIALHQGWYYGKPKEVDGVSFDYQTSSRMIED